MKHYPILFVCVFLLASIGCGKGYIPVSGTVTFSDDGSPLTAGTVCFESEAGYGRGTLDAQGKYVLGFDKPGSGVPKGTYKVYVADAMIQDGTTATKDSTGTSARPKYKYLIDKKFHTGNSSGLTFTADGSQKTFDFKVDRAK